MHVVIDRENMGFMWAHPNLQVLMNIAHLEADVGIHVVSLENPRYYQPFQAFTDFELKLLYENTTGEKYNGYNRDVLDQVVYGLAIRLPVLDCNAAELQVQADSVDEEFSGLYRYVKGSREPLLVQDGLFGVPAKRLGRSLEQERLAQLRELYPQMAAPAPIIARTGNDRPQAGTRTPARATRPAGVALPPRGSMRETIWACADQMWEQAGKPTSASAVLALRKKMMDVLEEQGVKRTSSSNELGNWQKVRLAPQQV